MKTQSALQSLIEQRDLSADEMRAVMREIMGGEATQAQIAAFLIALRLKGETTTELAAAAEVMRELSDKVEVADRAHLVDTCGTGGDGSCTFNVSTASAFVAGAAGAKVAKHGNRSVSSACGSADVLEALGVNVNLNASQISECVSEIGVGFMFAPNHHRAMKFAAPVRKELKVRTMFNLLGPMTNPAGAPNQVIGVFQQNLVAKFVQVLQILGSRHVLVVHGADGLDEISIAGETRVAELHDGRINEYTIKPNDFGIRTSQLSAIRVNNAEESKALLLSVLDNEAGPARDIVLMNAGAAIYAAGAAQTIARGIERAARAVESGGAKEKLRALIKLTNQFKT
ncbi:MAG: anthranilate phosphoribosyltransferase [Burkholderiales bacterium]